MPWGGMVMTTGTLAMFLVFLYTCYVSVTKLLQGDIVTTTGSALASIKYPSVTLCNVVDMSGVNATIDDVMRALPDRSSFIQSMYFNTNGYQLNITNFKESQWTQHVRIRFSLLLKTDLEICNCHTIELDHNAQVLDELVFSLNDNNTGVSTHGNITHNVTLNPNSLTITVHEDDQLIYSIYDVGGMFTLRKRDLSISEQGTSFQLQVAVDNMLSRNDNPCDPNNGQRLTDCIQSYITNKLQCRLPWITLDSFKALRRCNTTQDLWTYVNITTEVEMSTLESLLNKTGCKRNFKKYSYSAKLAYEFDAPSLAVSLICHQNDISVNTESYSYTATSLLADIGGYLGLLIGASVLNLLEYFIVAADYIKHKLGGAGRPKEK